MASSGRDVLVAISIDTEEDNWGSFAERGATVENIGHLTELQDAFDRWGARPTYLVNRPPLLDSRSTEVLGVLASREDVEIGAHCHPWNTPPLHSEGRHRSMMCTLSPEENRAKLLEIVRCLKEGLGVEPKVFRAGRWGMGTTVTRALVDLGFDIDCSVSPFIDWSSESGPDYSAAPHTPYRFTPESPLLPADDGTLLELPTTIGFVRGDQRRRAEVRRWLERSPLGRIGVLGVLDRMGVLKRRWLSPETSSAEDMIGLADALVGSGHSFLQLTFHSCTLLPAATPFVQDRHQRDAFLQSIGSFLSYCTESGFTFATLSEVGRALPTRATARPSAGL